MPVTCFEVWSRNANDFDAAVDRDINKINLALLPLLFIAFAAAIYHGYFAQAVGPVLLWSVTCLASGATLGFLFGIPKTSTSVVRGQGAHEPATTVSKPAAPGHAGSPTGLANMNLEEVSDWLTKIVVGLTLVHLARIRAFVVEVLKALAGEYERTRAAMAPGPERTQAMSGVASRMFTFGLAAAPYIRELANSASSGERLAAIIILRAKFYPEYSEWLAKRLVDDPPFIGYQAAKALLGGVRLLGGSQKTRLQDAVRDAQENLQQKNMNDANRDALIEQILKE
jgi:hypothetical protein